MNKTIYKIEIAESGDLIDSAASLEEAESIIKDFEDEDKRNNDFEENLYSIYKIENNKRFLYLFNWSWEEKY